jgi:hypothetical protein
MFESTPEISAVAAKIVEFLVGWGLSAAGGAGLAVLLMRTWLSEKIKAQIKSEYDEKLETHKAQLKAQSDVEIEKLKSELSIAAAQRNVRFSRLHERQAEIIAEVYEALSELVKAISDYVAIYEPASAPPREERRERAAEAANEFIALYRGKKIFFPPSTAAKLDEILLEIRTAYMRFAFKIDADRRTGGTMEWLDIFERIQKLSETTVVELECDFRTLLGHEDDVLR